MRAKLSGFFVRQSRSSNLSFIRDISRGGHEGVAANTTVAPVQELSSLYNRGVFIAPDGQHLSHMVRRSFSLHKVRHIGKVYVCKAIRVTVKSSER